MSFNETNAFLQWNQFSNMLSNESARILGIASIVEVPDITDDMLNMSLAVNGTSGNAVMTSILSAFPAIPRWISHIYLSLLCITLAVGIPGNAITVSAYSIIKVSALVN